MINIIADLLAVGGEARVLLSRGSKFTRNGATLTLEEAALALAVSTGVRLKLIGANDQLPILSFGRSMMEYLSDPSGPSPNYVAVFRKTSDVRHPTPPIVLKRFEDSAPPLREFIVPD